MRPDLCPFCPKDTYPHGPRFPRFGPHWAHAGRRCPYIVRDDQGIKFPCACDGSGSICAETVARFGVAHPQYVFAP